MHNVLVIGVGSIGERHTRCFLATGDAKVGICEPNDTLRNDVANRYRIERAFASVDEALAHAWDAAVIASPAHTHVPIALQLARAGVNLLMEKPVSTSLDGIPELLSLVGRKKVTAGVGYTYRSHPASRAMKTALDECRFGESLQLYATLGQDFAKYRPAFRDIYFADRAQGGGALQDALTHFVNLGEWFVGPITKVVADATHQHLEGVDVEDTVHLMARHGEVMASYALNLYQSSNESSVTVVCENGIARYEAHKSRWRWMIESDGEWRDEPHVLDDQDAWFVLQARAFLDALDGRCELSCTLAEGVQTLRVSLAALRSLETQGWIAIHD